MDAQTIARWESKSGKWWAELRRDQYGYAYRGVDCGGSLGILPSDADAVAELDRRVASGYFQPDANTTPMRRVA